MFNYLDKYRFSNYLFSFLGFLILIGIWLLSAEHLTRSIFLPSPILIIQRIYQLMVNGEVLHDLSISLTRLFGGFLFALLVGIPIGIVSSTNKLIKTLIESNIGFLRYIPTASLIPLAILWFGISEAEKTFLIFIGALPYIILYSSSSALNVEKEYLEVAQTLGATQKQMLTKIILPRILPDLWDVCRIELGGAWTLVILAEVIASNSGIGYKLVLAQRFMHTTDIFAFIILISLIGLIIDQIFKISYLYLFPWAEKNKISKQ